MQVSDFLQWKDRLTVARQHSKHCSSNSDDDAVCTWLGCVDPSGMLAGQRSIGEPLRVPFCSFCLFW